MAIITSLICDQQYLQDFLKQPPHPYLTIITTIGAIIMIIMIILIKILIIILI